MHNLSKVNGSRVTYGVKGDYVCIFRLFRENMTLSVRKIILYTEFFFVKAKIDLVAGSKLLIGSRRTTTSPPSTGRYLKKEASTGLGHINLWYGETHDDLSLENAILRINLFPTKIILKYKHIICVQGPDL